VNLRFYVRRTVAGEVRRGVVFVREIVPRWAIAKVAQVCFGEKYIALPMTHKVIEPTSEGGRIQPNIVGATGKMERHPRRSERPAGASAHRIARGILHRALLGIRRRSEGGTLGVPRGTRPLAHLADASASFEGDVSELYGADAGGTLSGAPARFRPGGGRFDGGGALGPEALKDAGGRLPPRTS
jgi:uncharacterized protein